MSDLLGVSYRCVEDEIEAGRLLALSAGSQRRVRFDDLAAFKKRIDAGWQDALDDLSALDEELELL